MKLYAIQNKKSKQYIYGTVFSYPTKQRLTSNIKEAMFFKDCEYMRITTESKRREINLKYYKLVEVEIKEVEYGDNPTRLRLYN